MGCERGAHGAIVVERAARDRSVANRPRTVMSADESIRTSDARLTTSCFFSSSDMSANAV